MDADLIELIHGSLAETVREITRRSHGVIHEEDGLLLYAGAPLDPALWNGAFRTTRGISADDLLAKAREFFEARGRGFTLHTMEPLDSDLDAAMTSSGRKPDSDSPEMVLETAIAPPSVPAGVTLQEVKTEVHREDFLATVSSAFQTLGVSPETWRAAYPNVGSLAAPHISAIVAYQGGTPAAAAMIYLSHGVAEVIHVGVRPAYRRRGLADLVTRAVTVAGFDRGVRLASLQATPMGEGLYRRMGYREICRYRWYVFQPRG